MSSIEPLESRQLCSAGALKAAYQHASTVDDAGRTITADLYKNAKQIVVKRFVADGSSDTSFGTAGVATIDNAPVTSTGGFAFSVIADHDDRPLVLSQLALYRLKSSGTLDKTFDVDGRLTVPIVRETQGIATDARDRPVIVGTSAGKTGDRATVLRLGERGALDRGFGSGGAYKRPVPIDRKAQVPGDSTGSAITVLADGQILAAGTTRFDRAESSVFIEGLDLWRLNADGTSDLAYNRKGTASVYHETNTGETVRDTFAAFTADGGAFAHYHYAFQDADDLDYFVHIDTKGTVGAEHFAELPTT